MVLSARALVASWPLPYIFASAEAAHTIDMPSQCPAKHGCTFAPRSDGFGSMYGGVLVAFAWCVAQNRTFCVPDLQDQMREQDEAQSKMTRSTRSWLLYFTLLEAVILVGVTTWQNLYLKSFFEVRRVV